MKKLFLIFLSVLLFACGEKKQEVITARPDNLVAEETMVNVLMDLHLIEASLSLKMMEDHRVARDTSQFYNPYEKYNLTKKEFEESFQYYASQPQRLNAIYEEVLNRINQKQVEVMKKVPRDTSAPALPKVRMPGMGPMHRPGIPPNQK